VYFQMFTQYGIPGSLVPEVSLRAVAEGIAPACVNGLCVARYQRNVDATKYDATCRANTDCNLIYTGEVCSSCRCGTATVNASGLPRERPSSLPRVDELGFQLTVRIA
jgi:hypothetical protein